jgi:tyrosine-protein phosphatase OCA6
MLINRVHQPIYIHCLNGSEVTSLVISCLRKLQCWAISSIMAEFGRFCLVKPAHTSFIETFHLEIEVLTIPFQSLRVDYESLSSMGV